MSRVEDTRVFRPLMSLAVGALLLAGGARGQPAAPSGTPPAPPPPYSLPWMLRPAVVGNVIRSDTSIAAFGSGSTTGTTVASMLLASYKVTPELQPFARLGYVSHAAPSPAASGTSFVNPVLGAVYGLKPSPDLRMTVMLASTVPLGQGGGNEPDPKASEAARSGVSARSAMDNAMFAVNDLTLFPGVDLAWVKHGFTVQAEATTLFLFRVRGEQRQPDSFKVNFTSGVHVGYSIAPIVSVGAELRYQRWLSTPVAVERDHTLRQQATFAVGPRFHFKAGATWLRPGLSYTRGLDNPMAAREYSVVQLDLPVAF